MTEQVEHQSSAVITDPMAAAKAAAAERERLRREEAAERERIAARRPKAFKCLESWAAHRHRAPMWKPGPADYSRPMGEQSDYVWATESSWKLVEDLLAEFGAGGAYHARHPLRRLLLWMHDSASSMASHTPENFQWTTCLPGLTHEEIKYVLGMQPHSRARGDYESFIRHLEERMEAVEAQNGNQAPLVVELDDRVGTDSDRSQSRGLA